MKDKIKKLITDKKLISSAASCLFLLVAIVIVVVAVMQKGLAWFSQNKNVTGSGMSLTVRADYMRFDDTFTAKAVMNETEIAAGTYRRDTDGKYYLLQEDENGSATSEFDTSSGAKKSVFYDSLYPGEYIEMTFRFTCAESRRNEKSGYKLYFDGLTPGKDSAGNNTGCDTFEAGDGTNKMTYSILGIYRLEAGTYNEKGTFTPYTNAGGFLNDFTPIDNDHPAPATADIYKGNWSGAEWETLTIRLHIDLSEYNKLPGVVSNLLAEKSARIASVVLAPDEGGENA